MNVLALIAAMIVGAALSVAGATMQSVLRNPLAEPYLLGTVGGAALFSVLAMNFALTAFGAWVLPAASFFGSVCSLALVCAVALYAARSRRLDGSDPALRSSGSSIVLAGFITAGFTGAMEMVVLSWSEPLTHARLNRWLFGSLNEVNGTMVMVGAIGFAVALAVLLGLAKWLDVVELGRDESECLGVNSSKIIVIALLVVSLMTSLTVALAGAIGFVGLVVPHFVRRLTGPRMGRVLPAAALAGAVFLLVAEAVTELFGNRISVGIVAALIGAPIFFHMLMRRHNGEGWDV